MLNRLNAEIVAAIFSCSAKFVGYVRAQKWFIQKCICYLQLLPIVFIYTHKISCALFTAKAKKFTLPMADVVSSLVPLLPAPATFPIALWSLGPLLAM